MASMRFEDETTNQVCMMMHDAYVDFSVATSRTKPHVDDGFIEKPSMSWASTRGLRVVLFDVDTQVWVFRWCQQNNGG